MTEKAPQARPHVLASDSYKVSTPCGNLYIIITYRPEDKERNPLECFLYLGKSGSCQRVYLESIGRLVAISLRSGVNPKAITRTLMGMQCPNSFWDKVVGADLTKSCIDALAKILNLYPMEDKERNS